MISVTWQDTLLFVAFCAEADGRRNNFIGVTGITSGQFQCWGRVFATTSLLLLPPKPVCDGYDLKFVVDERRFRTHG